MGTIPHRGSFSAMVALIRSSGSLHTGQPLEPRGDRRMYTVTPGRVHRYRVIYLSIYIYIILPVPWFQHLLPFPVHAIEFDPSSSSSSSFIFFYKAVKRREVRPSKFTQALCRHPRRPHRVNIEYTPLLDPLSCPHRTIRSYDPPLASAPARQHESMVCIVHVCRLPEPEITWL